MLRLFVTVQDLLKTGFQGTNPQCWTVRYGLL